MSSFDPNDPDFQYLAVDRKKLIKEQKGTFDAKKACWAPDEQEGFVSAEIQETSGEKVTVKIVDTNEVRRHWYLFYVLSFIIVSYIICHLISITPEVVPGRRGPQQPMQVVRGDWTVWPVFTGRSDIAVIFLRVTLITKEQNNCIWLF